MKFTNQTNSKRIAILIENQFHDFQLQIPQTALKQAGAKVILLGSRMNERYSSKSGKITYYPDATPSEMRASDFDAIFIIVGEIRANPFAVSLVNEAIDLNKIISTVDYGIQILIDTKKLSGKKVTANPSIRIDLENAGAIYLKDSVVVDNNLITARGTGALPILTTTLLNHLELKIKGTTLPQINDRTFAWWKLAQSWGGSSKWEIIKALNTVIIGERYTLEAFKQYSYRSSDREVRALLQEISSIKQRHVQLLEAHLYNTFKEQVSWQAVGSEAYAALISWLQSSDELLILRRALGDIQTGVVDTYHLIYQLSDPQTIIILEEIHQDLIQYEERLVDLYQSFSGDRIKPPLPTTIAAI